VEQISGVPARAGALALLQAVLWRGEPLDRSIDRAFRKLDAPADRGLARAIVSGVLRHLPDLDSLIDGATKKPLPDDARARMVLRMALVQTILLETPPHAVIATALPLLEGGPRRLAHGVLSTLLKQGAALPSPPSLPDMWTVRWGASWGEDVVAAAAVGLGAEPPLDLTLRDAAERLGGTSLMPGHVRLARHGRIEELPGFEEGAWWVQDLAASLPARLLDAKAGEAVADLCAAPGGKTLQLASAGAKVIALDISENRIVRVRENLERTGLSADVVAADALKWKPPAPLDAVLLDAPCSGTGIFRRHPDVLHLKSARQIGELVRMQAALMDHAFDTLKPGGRMLYCVCSLERDEGESQVQAFLSRTPWARVVPVAGDELPAGIAPNSEGFVRTLPGQLAADGGLDGFFMARIARV
jgi:16S rRNA (cytosine967-C5)-methyltransferase